MLRVEFHCHTCYSKDCLTSLEDLLAASRRKNIDRVVISDHNTIAGAIRAQQLDPERFIVGEEIMTSAGELLACFVQEEIPPGLPPSSVIAQLRAQGAFIIVPHPFDHLRNGGWKLHDLELILPLVDAIETFNARCLWPPSNWQAQAFARQHGMLETVGSDAHTLGEVGQATLLLPAFNDAASLKASLQGAWAKKRLSPPWVHLASRWASRVKSSQKD